MPSCYTAATPISRWVRLIEITRFATFGTAVVTLDCVNAWRLGTSFLAASSAESTNKTTSGFTSLDASMWPSQPQFPIRGFAMSISRWADSITRRLTRRPPYDDVQPTVEWQVNGHCNYDCTYCIQSKASRVGVPDEARVKAIIGTFATLPGTWEIKMSGGEPFAFRGFVKVLSSRSW